MHTKLVGSSVAALATLVTAVCWGQTPNPPPTPDAQSTDPSAASTPHQRATTRSTATETAPTGGSNPSDASTPAQADQLKKSKNSAASKKMMKDCMTKQSTDSSTMSKADKKKACMEQMSSMDHGSMSQ